MENIQRVSLQVKNIQYGCSIGLIARGQSNQWNNSCYDTSSTGRGTCGICGIQMSHSLAIAKHKTLAHIARSPLDNFMDVPKRR